MKNNVLTAAVLAVAILVASVAWADVFSMPGGETSMQFVGVGNVGNAADAGTNYGSVDYAYQMGTFDVTVGQYCQFLNAVAATDTYGLYNVEMGDEFSTSISRSGSSGGYSYSVTGSYGQGANCPIFDVTWGDAARFANWLQNGQPTGSEGSGTTETGAYTLNGAVSDTALTAVTRNAGATYFIPSENEWYKAAYYKTGGTNAGYWTYPTKSNTAPSNVLSITGTNNANYYNGSTYTAPGNSFTPVGTFAASPGPYGTYDQGGDVWQWNETPVAGDARGLRGGAWTSPVSGLAYNSYSAADSALTMWDIGFRLASVASSVSAGSHTQAIGTTGGLATFGGSQATFTTVTGTGTFSSTYFTPSTASDLASDIGPAAAGSIAFTQAGSTDQVWTLGFDGSFSGSVTVVLAYDPSLVTVDPSLLAIEQWNSTTDMWNLLYGTVDTTADTITFTTGSFSPFMLAAVPEPSTFVFLGIGSAGLLAFAWRKRRAA